MDLTDQINALPKPPIDYVRAIRVELKSNAYRGANYSGIVKKGWRSMPTPQEESNYSIQKFDEFEVCAAHPQNFHAWFTPDMVEDLDEDARIVALDVPRHAAKVLPKQLVIMRHLAKEVAVLLQ